MKDPLIGEIHRELQIRLGSNLKQVILFGSRARGEEEQGSDYDILIIVDEITSELKNIIDDIAGNFLFEYNQIFSIFPVLKDRYQKGTPEPFLRTVMNEGIAL